MEKFMHAVDKQTPQTKYFRKIVHWLATADRWAVAAISTEQWSHQLHEVYKNTILHLCETEAYRYGRMLGEAIAMLYDELRKRSINKKRRGTTSRYRHKATCWKVPERSMRPSWARPRPRSDMFSRRGLEPANTPVVAPTNAISPT